MWKADLDAGETSRNFELALKRLDSATDIHPDDKKDIGRYDNNLLAEGISKERVRIHQPYHGPQQKLVLRMAPFIRCCYIIMMSSIFDFDAKDST